MTKGFLLIFVIGIKVLLTKALSLMIIILSFWLKGKSIHKNSDDWNSYFLTLSNTFVFKYATCIYVVSTLVSSITAYGLFRVFKFQYSLYLATALLTVGVIFTWCKYQRKGKQELTEALHKVHKSAEEELYEK